MSLHQEATQRGRETPDDNDTARDDAPRSDRTDESS
jgi:hypothetical protein